MKYFQVIGGSGSGKSTFAQKLADNMKVEYIELDAINWQPNWESLEPEKMKAEVKKQINSRKKVGWVVDGSYSGRIGNLVTDSADTIIFLQIPLLITIPRLIVRGLKRIITKEKLWGVNTENLKGLCALLRFTIKFHRKRIRRLNELKREYDATGEKKVLIFKSNRTANAWLNDLGSL